MILLIAKGSDLRSFVVSDVEKDGDTLTVVSEVIEDEVSPLEKWIGKQIQQQAIAVDEGKASTNEYKFSVETGDHVSNSCFVLSVNYADNDATTIQFLGDEWEEA